MHISREKGTGFSWNVVPKNVRKDVELFISSWNRENLLITLYEDLQTFLTLAYTVTSCWLAYFTILSVDIRVETESVSSQRYASDKIKTLDHARIWLHINWSKMRFKPVLWMRDKNNLWYFQYIFCEYHKSRQRWPKDLSNLYSTFQRSMNMEH